jgi:transposase
MRVTSAFSRLLCLPGVSVRSVSFEPDRVLVTVALRARRLRCPQCAYCTRHRESKQRHDSVWRHLDLGVWRLEVHARLRRLRCPEHGALVEGVPFARDGARFTRDFEDLVAWLMTKRHDHDRPADPDQLAHGRADHQACRRRAARPGPAQRSV